MKIHYTKRRMGKTQRCILGLAEDPDSILIVSDSSSKNLIVNKGKGIQDIENRVFSAHGIRVIEGLNPDYSIIIDDIDIVVRTIGIDGLFYLSRRHEIKFATATIKEINNCSDETVTVTI